MKGHRTGTHRAVPPEITLERARPLLERFGVTRIADVTGLDSLGVPTYCAIRPTARTIQVSNGKGLRAVDATVSAIMESFEVAVGESEPTPPLVRRSIEELTGAGEAFSFELPAHARAPRPPLGKIEWVRGDDLATGAPILLPAATAWLRPRQVAPYDWSGLASGNTLVEATLHALYEVVERHLVSSFVVDGRLDFSGADVLFEEGRAESVADLSARIRAGGVKLLLLRARTTMPVHAFMAVLLDAQPFGGASTVNLGYGAHLDPETAATRAITEAAQSRLTFIHGAREDLHESTYEHGPLHARLYEFFDRIEPRTPWRELVDHSSDALEADLARLRAAMTDGGLARAYRIDMTPPDVPFAVVKVVVPDAELRIPV